MKTTDSITFIRQYLKSCELTYEQSGQDTFVITLPGERKLQTNMSLTVGAHAMTINAFVSRNPEENHEAVYRWLLERNRRMYAVAFAIDHLGDIYLTGRLPLNSITSAELDRVLGSVLEYSDGAFNTILELGFAASIKREWAWRISRGESTANLAAFAHLTEVDQARGPN
ncbi:MAG: YbjN domain-containing protein [Actinobacteria bacterium]|nr:MAG: YbjN domain-containing protein [Actinomycetota bacterium]